VKIKFEKNNETTKRLFDSQSQTEIQSAITLFTSLIIYLFGLESNSIFSLKESTAELIEQQKTNF